MPKTREVEFTYPWTDPKSQKAYETGATADLPDLQARQLIHLGRARAVEPPASVAPQAPAVDPAPVTDQVAPVSATGPTEAAETPPQISATASAARTSTEPAAAPSTRKGR